MFILSVFLILVVIISNKQICRYLVINKVIIIII